MCKDNISYILANDIAYIYANNLMHITVVD